MAKKLYEEEDIREIACAIREKCGDETAKYKCCDMPAAIRNLTIGFYPVIEPLEITANGTYAAADGVDGYNPITVNVPKNTDAEDAVVSGHWELIPGVVEAPYQYNNYTAPAVRSYFMYRTNAIRNVYFESATSIGDSAFWGCWDLMVANFPAVTEIGSSAFNQCYLLNTAIFPSVKKIGWAAFNGCSLGHFNFPNVEDISDHAFYSGLAIKQIRCVAKHIGTYAFRNCPLTQADFTSLEKMGIGALMDNENLHTLALRYNGVCKIVDEMGKELDSDGIYGTAIANGNGYIYVRASLVDRYKADGSWSKYADQIRALEDYTVDGTYYGDLDESKI